MAQKNPLKFYDQVFNQEITKHKTKEGKTNRNGEQSPEKQEKEIKQLTKKKTLEVTSKVTKRPYLKIMEKINDKLKEMLKNKIGDEFEQNILSALKDKAIEQEVKELLKKDKLQLQNEEN